MNLKHQQAAAFSHWEVFWFTPVRGCEMARADQQRAVTTTYLRT